MARTPQDPAVADPASEPVTESTPNTVRLRLHRSFPVDAFEHTVDGKAYTVTDDDAGVEVPAEHEEAITSAAKDAGLTVKKVTE